MAPVTNARVLFASIPKGFPVPGETTVYDTAQKIDLEGVPLNSGFLIKTLVLSVDPYMRNRMHGPEKKSYSPPFALGAPLIGYGVGVVLRSENSDVAVGKYVYGIIPHQQYSIIGGMQGLSFLQKDPKLPWTVFVGAAGMPGMGIRRAPHDDGLTILRQDRLLRMEGILTREKGKETVVLHLDRSPTYHSRVKRPSSPPAEVRSARRPFFISMKEENNNSALRMVIQLAKRDGLKVIASAGSEEKVKFMREIGADVAFNYKTTNTREVLEREGPIDVYWDNVGGEILEAALDNANDYARFLLCGSISGYNTGHQGVRNLNQLYGKAATMYGVLVFRLQAKYDREFYEVIPPALASGELKYTEDVSRGLETVGEMILRVQEGRNTGKAVVVVAEEPTTRLSCCKCAEAPGYSDLLIEVLVLERWNDFMSSDAAELSRVFAKAPTFLLVNLKYKGPSFFGGAVPDRQMFLTILHVACLVVGAMTASVGQHVRIQNDDPLIFFHGRWDTAPETWWSGSGFKINVQDLSSLTLNLGPNTTAPVIALGISVDYAPFFSLNASAGANVIPLALRPQKKLPGATTVVRINAEMYFDSQMNLESIDLNPGARLVPYVPSKLAFEFIGDSFSTGYTTPEGIIQAWDFLIGETFKAEESVVAQPGAALVDILSYGNTEDTSYYYDPIHNYTTPWNFRRDVPERTHIVVHIGANDAAQNVTQELFVSTYIDFFGQMRLPLLTMNIFADVTQWGWPSPDGPNAYYYTGAYQEVLDARRSLGDRNMFLVNCTGWVTYADVYPDDLHPNVEGHMKIAGLFQDYLENWGLHPLKEWSNP
ncbi:SGNH hydrolase [Mycena sanguinolenta]|uniref:SGNH hydrolase n=1 Tax=Mycena sanguinolenta TaxID=230812 RepID=A0A8H6ZEA5_9AGAR|nr:SGNH hydrolase [Mycena sanguinolenta]